MYDNFISYYFHVGDAVKTEGGEKRARDDTSGGAGSDGADLKKMKVDPEVTRLCVVKFFLFFF